MNTLSRPIAAAFAIAALLAGAALPQEDTADMSVPENLYVGELVSYPGPFAFQLGKQAIILVSDAELETLSADPDAVLDLSLTFDKREDSLRAICERARAAGQRTLLISFDHFFKQYRPGQDTPRRLMPDTEEYADHIAKVAEFAAGYGLALELSLLSPLEIGPGYRDQTGESGVWMHYRKGLRDPQTGAFSVQLWRQLQWCNNKGPLSIEDAGVRVFAFRERPVPGTPYLAVDPADIVEITDAAQVEVWEGTRVRLGDYAAVRIEVSGQGRADVGDLNRVLVVQSYRTPEMDYFSEQALPFLKGLVDMYVDRGVHFNALYSDEMHIQQDWGYFAHHDNGEFALRYVSDGLRRRFAEEYGAEYEDFAKYLVYFCRGQEDTRNDLRAKEGMMHVLGPTPEDIRRTSLLRARYYKLLQDGVVDLFVDAKRYMERAMGHKLESRAHATWAESPTIDRWDTGHDHGARNMYEYTSNFIWSCTVHQASAACHDYFKWGEFLTGTGNDHSEGGWLDRNYYGLALGCSTGIVNEVPFSYAAHWGSPQEITMRHGWLQSAFGTASSPQHNTVQDMQHRDVDVMMLYPLDLVSADERFGSWMTQYGYANYIPAWQAVEMGKVEDGALIIAGRRFTTLAALFEPHPPAALLDLMEQLVDQGGRVVWSGPPPLLSFEGEPLLERWQNLFGVDHVPVPRGGWVTPGRLVRFEGPLESVSEMIILTDLLVDLTYPVTPRDGTEVAARCKRDIVGTQRRANSGGSATFLGFRPRDDQSGSLGYDQRTWFEILYSLGSYGGTGAFSDANDNTEVLSRTGDWLACRFPNGAISVSPHLRGYEESWGGGFGRRPEEDEEVLRDNPPPPREMRLERYRVWGHTVDYVGHGVMSFRVDDAGNVVAFAGQACAEITVDGKTWRFTDQPSGGVMWAPVREDCRVPGGAVMTIYAGVDGELRVPAAGLPASVTVVAEGPRPGSRGAQIPSRLEGEALVLTLEPGHPFGPLYVVPEQP